MSNINNKRRTPAKKNDWRTCEMPEQHDEFILKRHFSDEEIEIMKYGLIPLVMEDKWFFYYDEGKFYAHRSWTGHCIFIVFLDFGTDLHKVYVNRDENQYRLKDIQKDKKLINDLFDYQKKSFCSNFPNHFIKNSYSTQCQYCLYNDLNDHNHCDKYKIQNKPSYINPPDNKECSEFECKDKLIIDPENDFERKTYGGLFGAITGDALGVPVEFIIRKILSLNPVKEMRGYGTHDQPLGTWSDDSSMLLCQLESINEGYTPEKLASKFVMFAEESYMTPYNVVFDIGNAVSKSIRRIKDGIPAVECGGIHERDNGNGSLMRILPLAFYLQKADDDKLIQTVEESSSLTHRHNISKLSCIFYVYMARELINGKDKAEAYQCAIKFIETNLKENYSDDISNFERLLEGKISDYPSDEIRSGGYVIHTLEASIWCLLNTNSYAECVLKAVNLGDDTDTTTCVAGGLAGIYYGIESIPDNWIQILAKKFEINDMIKRFIDVVK